MPCLSSTTHISLPIGAKGCGAHMDNIYQDIWNADQDANGIQARTEGQSGDPNRGHVTVKDGRATADFRILDDVHIPEHKQESYRLVRQLFDNYSLAERNPELDTPQEREEVHELLTAVVETPPMQVAREYVERATGTSVTRERWYATLLEHWFRKFSQDGDPHLTGFEHVVVGEQDGGKVQGYHFWYKYFLDDGFARRYDSKTFPHLANDRIEYLRSKASAGQADFPESVTLSYRWLAPDYSADAEIRPLTKKIGGFFVGCSVEGLMALGSVRAHLGARAPKEALINGARYDLKMYRGSNGNSIRTFYPVFLGSSFGESPPKPPAEPSDMRIVAALINPLEADVGNETVTVVNTGLGAAAVEAWQLEDKNGKRSPLGLNKVAPGQFVTVRLSGEPRQVQLANKGGSIRLLNHHGQRVHSVSYTKTQGQRQGQTIVF